MSLFEVLFLVVILLTNVIQAITGFAGTTLAMPVSLRLVGPDVARPVLNLAAVIICIYVVIRHFKDIQWLEFLKMIVCVGVGFGIGFALQLLPIESTYLMKFYGITIMSVALLYMFVDIDKVKIPSWVLYLCLFLGGIVHELYISGGPLVVIYAMKRFKDKNAFRANLSLMWIALNGVLFATHLGNGLFSPHIWLLVGIAFAVSVLSYVVGSLLAKKMPLPIFMKVTYVLLFISGLSIIL